jgi:hypothetical protein
MSSYISQRLLLAALIAVLLPVAAFAQSQDSDSVAEAARRARNQKKTSGKTSRVINDDNLKPSTPPPTGAASDSSATPSDAAAGAQPLEACQTIEESKPALPPGMSPDALSEPPHTQQRCAPAPANVPTPASTEGGNANAVPDQKSASELAKLNDELKEAQKELDFLQRELSLDQDSYFSNPDYAHNTSGKSKLDTLQQRVGDKQQEVERLKARLVALKDAQGSAKSTLPQP